MFSNCGIWDVKKADAHVLSNVHTEIRPGRRCATPPDAFAQQGLLDQLR